MADRPLRPATRRRLGGPLPHQQADRPRVPPEAVILSSQTHAGSWGHPVLAAVSRCYSGLRGRLLTCYAPVRHLVFTGVATGWTPFDLHVLGTPPAFVLSQDQTLHRRSPLDPEGSGRHRRAGSGLATLADMKLAQHGLLSVISAIDFYDRRRRTRRSPRSPALAFGCSYSVLKERRRSTLPRGRRCPCALQDRCDRHVDRTRHWPHIATGVRSSRLSSIYFGRFRHRSGILH